MAITQEQISLAQKTLKLYWDSYLKGDVDSFASTLYDDFQLIGTSENEICKNKAEGIEYCRSHKESVVGTVKKENTQLNSLVIDELLLFNEFFDIHIKIENTWKFYAKGRASSVLKKTTKGWKIVQQHGSIPDSQVEGDETLAFEQISKENIELRNAIKRRTKELELKNKELEIEASSERVRAQAMAMQSPDDIMIVLSVLKEEIHKFNIGNISTWIWIFNDDGTITQWDISESITANINANFNFSFDPSKYDQINRHEEFRNSNESYYTIKWSGKDLQTLIDQVSDIDPESGKIFQDSVNNEHIIEYWQSSSPFDNGIMGLDFIKEPDKETSQLLIKMCEAFGVAYRRFLDLQKAEEQAYNIKVEASLERVRGMAAAMNHSEDLMQIAEVMFKEMEILKINPLRYGLAMIDSDKREAELWASTVNDGHALNLLGKISLTWHPMLQKAYDAWDAQHEELIYELKGAELSDYYQKIGAVNPEIPDLEALQNPDNSTTQFCSFFPFKLGTLYAFTTGKPDEDGKSILKRFSNVFEQAHIRYNDLQITEEQALLIKNERDRLEITLKELRSTQDQLVQQEKLASLGQLTAGIAHEIKNPLNFVNNFSELSIELIEEIKGELRAYRQVRTNSEVQTPRDTSIQESSPEKESPTGEENLNEITDLLEDIEINLKNILKHGTRADGIVKSMLQHSRGGAGKLEPTNINSMLKEFVTLSFHGMRASKNPFNVDLQYVLDESIHEIGIIAEDFSRVIVNLCKNAFDAMYDKLVIDSSYKPMLTTRTYSKGDKLFIEIEDNGPGIPEDMKDKILQPFFTTKKGTEGTGLGLSITNDIIKAHGGSLQIDSSVTGSNFIISLSNL